MMPPAAPENIAAVDLGSNSFHMIIARVTDGHIQVIDKLREMVRLGAGLDRNKNLTPEAQTRALACLKRFGQRLDSFPPGSVRAVGTNTLRQVKEGDEFLAAAQAALGHPIEIIAGHEEARLIYLGVAHGLPMNDEQRLVVDIGGGSTELIVGRSFDTLRRESLYMGCVNMSGDHLPDGRITEEAMKAAELASALELRPVRAEYRRIGWQNAIGSSGTIRAIGNIVHNAGWSRNGITLPALKKLRETLIRTGHADRLELDGLSADRRWVFPGGVAVLLAVFNTLRIDRMQVSNQALREGLLYDMLGRIRQEDVRKRTVRGLCERFNVDREHAAQVEFTARSLFEQAVNEWIIPGEDQIDILMRAARLHEIGLTVSHAHFHKHGAYLIENSDLSGFSRRDQTLLAVLVRGHRRKFPLAVFETLPENTRENAKRLCILLRLAALLHRGRSATACPPVKLTATETRLHLAFPDNWLRQHPLTHMELTQEAKRLEMAGFHLRFS